MSGPSTAGPARADGVEGPAGSPAQASGPYRSGSRDHPATDVRRGSIRVALSAAALVAIAYLLVAVGVIVIVSRDLTAQIDDRLTASLSHVPNQPFPGGGQFEAPPSDHPYGPLLLTWTIKAEGGVMAGPSAPTLPTAYEHVRSPVTATIDGVQIRLAGAAAGDDYVVVGQTLETVSQARSTLILAELIICPFLLIMVFLGAVAIGRRVAMPIEIARQRQLEFTADASHELRTPLSVIEANTSLALAAERPAEWYRNAFGRIDHESKRMRRLLEDLLWLARFDATQAHPASEAVDLPTLAAQAADRFAAVAEARHLNLRMEAPPDGLVVTGPPDWLDRLLGVLLDNAIKYSPDGGVVTVRVAPEGNRVALTVDDAGPGIPEGERARIFDRFHRATDARGGAGLGLAIADAIVRATGGRWTIGSSPAGGASMSVSWVRILGGHREPVVQRA